MVSLKKKPNAMTCEDHRTISLLTHASKIVLESTQREFNEELKEITV